MEPSLQKPAHSAAQHALVLTHQPAHTIPAVHIWRQICKQQTMRCDLNATLKIHFTLRAITIAFSIPLQPFEHTRHGHTVSTRHATRWKKQSVAGFFCRRSSLSSSAENWKRLCRHLLPNSFPRNFFL